MERAYAEIVGGPRDGEVIPVDGHRRYEPLLGPVLLRVGELPLPDHELPTRVYHLCRRPICSQRADDPCRGYRYVLQSE